MSLESNYYSNKEYISNSMLGWLKKSPAYFKAKINSDLELKESLSLERGKLLHLAILEPDKFVVADITPIEGKLGIFIETLAKSVLSSEDKSRELTEDQYVSALNKAGFKQDISVVLKNFNKTESQAYYNFLLEADNKLIINQETKYIIDNCKRNLKSKPVIDELLFDDFNYETYNEVELYWNINSLFKAKCKLDRLAINHNRQVIFNIDLKTTSSNVYGELYKLHSTGNPNIDFIGTGFWKSYLQYDYYRQQAFYEQAIRDNYPQYAHYEIISIVICVETGNAFDCTYYDIPNELLNYGVSQYTQLIELYNWCNYKNIWNFTKEEFDKNANFDLVYLKV